LTRTLQRGFHGDVVDAGGEDFLDVLFEHRESITGERGKAEKSTPRPDARPHELMNTPGFNHGMSL
jgi:hypothetical protein